MARLRYRRTRDGVEISRIRVTAVEAASAPDARNARKRERLQNAVAKVDATVIELVDGFDEASSARRARLQADLRAMSDRVSALVPLGTQRKYDKPADLLVNAIAAARMYFWRTVTCPWYGATYDVTTGNVLWPSAPEGVVSYKVQIDGNDIKGELP